MTMLNAIGWLATAVFASSYFFRQPATLRKVQAGAALLWVAYGFLIAMPVVVANMIVAGAAVYSSFAQRRARLSQLQPQAMNAPGNES